MSVKYTGKNVYYTEIQDDPYAWSTYRGFTSVAVAKKFYNPEFFKTGMHRATVEEVNEIARGGGLEDIQVFTAKDVKHPALQNRKEG